MPTRFNSEQYAEHRQTDRDDLENELATNPNNLGFYGEQFAQWNAEVERLKAKRDVEAGKITTDLRESGAKTTADLITAKVDTDPDYQAVLVQLHDAIEQRELFNMAVGTLRAKQSSLGSLNAIQRTEFGATTNVVPRSTSEEKAERRARFSSQQS